MMDTREKLGKKGAILEAFAEAGVRVVRSKLYVGDYTRLDNQTTCIDTKQNLQEVYSNLVQQHARFKDEVLRAKSAGIRLIILIEDETIRDVDGVKSWLNPRYAQWKRKKPGKRPDRPPVSSAQIARNMHTLSERYGVEWRFCGPGESGKVILQILTDPDGGDGGAD